ncbi:MAG: PH domain-containing protein [Devosia sp.]
MEKIESVAVDQNFFGRLFDYGTIDIRGTGAGLEQLSGIAAPLALRNAINAQ